MTRTKRRRRRAIVRSLVQVGLRKWLGRLVAGNVQTSGASILPPPQKKLETRRGRRAARFAKSRATTLDSCQCSFVRLKRVTAARRLFADRPLSNVQMAEKPCRCAHLKVNEILVPGCATRPGSSDRDVERQATTVDTSVGITDPPTTDFISSISFTSTNFPRSPYTSPHPACHLVALSERRKPSSIVMIPWTNQTRLLPSPGMPTPCSGCTFTLNHVLTL